MTDHPRREHDAFDWSSSPLRAIKAAEGWWVKGLLSVGVSDRPGRYLIPYGACAADRETAIQKALSEMAERVVWFVTWRDLVKEGQLNSAYTTTGWSAHLTPAAASEGSIGEYLERAIFQKLDQALADPVEAPLPVSLAGAFPLSIADQPWVDLFTFSLVLPVFLPGENLYLAYAMSLARERLMSEEPPGIIFGMGHAPDLDTAVFNARTESLLVARSIAAQIRKPASHSSTTDTINLAAYDAQYFLGLYRHPHVKKRVGLLHEAVAPKGGPLVPVPWPESPAFETLDFSWLQPPWLSPLGRSVCFSGDTNSPWLRRLRRRYCLGQ